MIARILIACGLLVSLAVPAGEVVKKERLLASGQSMLLDLGPVDPRSLVQGDYMRLDYALSRNVAVDGSWPRDGALIVRLDEYGVARFVRRDDGAALAQGEHRLAYRVRGRRAHIGTDAYFFQEGTADRYQRARYGEMRVAPDGSAVLVGLRDVEGRAIEAH